MNTILWWLLGGEGGGGGCAGLFLSLMPSTIRVCAQSRVILRLINFNNALLVCAPLCALLCCTCYLDTHVLEVLWVGDSKDW